MDLLGSKQGANRKLCVKLSDHDQPRNLQISSTAYWDNILKKWLRHTRLSSYLNLILNISDRVLVSNSSTMVNMSSINELTNLNKYLNHSSKQAEQSCQKRGGNRHSKMI